MTEFGLNSILELLPKSMGSFARFMVVFVVAAGAAAAVIVLALWVVRRLRQNAAKRSREKRMKQLDSLLAKRGFTRTLVISDYFAIDEGTGMFYCLFPYGGKTADAVLSLSCITGYSIEPAAAFTDGYLFTFTFVDKYAVRKLTRSANVCSDELCRRLLTMLDKYGAVKSQAASASNDTDTDTDAG